MSEPEDRIPVVYVAGLQRSGTTILGDVLDEVPGYFFAGELVHFWSHGVLEGGYCGCGEPFHACPLWTEVAGRAFDGIEDVTQDTAERRVDRNPGPADVPWMLVPGGDRILRDRLSDWLERRAKLYRAIKETSQANVIVDTSKYPVYGRALALIPDIDLYVVHLVRDPRGVANSRQRVKRIPHPKEDDKYMDRWHPATTALRWNVINITTSLVLKRAALRFLRIQYHAFTQDPRQTLERIVDMVDAGGETLPFVEPSTVDLSGNHVFSSNPNRFKDGPVEIERDDAWRRNLSLTHRRIVTALTFPFLHLYGHADEPHRKSVGGRDDS